MIMKVLSVYDSKGLFYMQPFFISTAVGDAIRSFGDACVKDSPIAAHPGDYQLYEIGTFDNCSAVFTTITPMKLLASGLDFGARAVELAVSKVTEKIHGLEVENGSQKVG